MIQSVQRISQILNLFRDDTSLSLAQIAEKTGLAKTTVYGFVSSLKEEGFLEQDPETRRYSLGLTVFELASYFHARKDLRAIAIPFIDGLARELGLTVQLAVLDRDQVVYLYKAATADFLTFSISAGLRMPFHCTATGKVLTAYLPEEAQNQLLATHIFTPKTPFSVASPSDMAQVLTQVRADGYGLDLEESETGLGGLAVPIFEAGENVAGALGLSFLSETFSEDFLNHRLPPLKSCAELISRKLGWVPPCHSFFS
jgi:IclR family KDG regulon transcriptional repressor